MGKRNRLLLASGLALVVASTANATLHQSFHADRPGDQSTVTAPAKPSLDDVLSEGGIARGSAKARMLAGWFEMVLHDPVIARRIPGGARGLRQIFLNEGKREALMSSGLARLTSEDRLLYLQLFSRLLDELVPVNCFGLVDMSAVMNRITMAQMSDTDAELYLRLLYKVLVSSTSDAPVRLPSPQEYAAALEQLSGAIVIELDADPANLDRYELYTLHPSAATPSDVCWMTRVTLHAIAKMPRMERDFVLLPTITGQGAGALAIPGAANPAQAPPPARNRPTDTTMP